MGNTQRTRNSVNNVVSVKPPRQFLTKDEFFDTWYIWKRNFLTFKKSLSKDSYPKEWGDTLLNIMGPVGLDIYNTFIFSSPNERNNVDILLQKFDEYFLFLKNEVIERYNFFTARKNKKQSIDNYIKYLRNKAKTCNFGNMTDSLIRDKIILEIQDKHLQQKLFSIKNLDLLTLVSVFIKHTHIRERKQTTNTDNTTVMNNNIDINFESTKNIKYCDKKVSLNINSNEKSINKQNVKHCKRYRYPCESIDSEKKTNERNDTNSKNLQEINQQLPSAPPLDCDDALYPNLNHIKVSQQVMDASTWSWLTSKEIKNENLQKSKASFAQNRNLTTEPFDVNRNRDNIKTDSKCCIS
ncbi:PREDICTED: uncharacterized protein LOC108556220 [Eufriesea mexicana]|uniref:uncharacterized protein LOC108556220 n=1 Tax=Eufriesea mexicana TaxID=516756 RepID=UPI00083C2786|nr:PREDICTED: uncharacterized protein LOC108556220 [Eufriesea mexicana]